MPVAKSEVLKGGATTFLRNRAFRILPAYWVVVLFALGIGLITKDTDWQGVIYSVDAWSTLFLTHDFIGTRIIYDRALWSLAPEVHIYCTFPIAVYLWRHFGLYKGYTAIFAALFLLTRLESNFGWSAIYLYIIFYIGTVAAWIAFSERPSIDIYKMLPWAKVATLLFAAFAGLEIAKGHEGYAAAVPYFAIGWGLVMASILIALTSGTLPKVQSILEHDTAYKVGEMSYSLYLLHCPVAFMALYLIHTEAMNYPAAVFSIIGTVVPISFAIAWLSYRFIERPYFTAKQRIKP